jgi:hypothetical protein
LRPVTTLADPALIASALALAGAGAAVLWARRRALPLAWAVTWFLITVLPAANLMPVPGSRILPMADRYLYLPSVGVAFAMALLLERAAAGARDGRTSARVRVIGLLAILTMYALPGLIWSDIWRDNRRLYAHMVRTSPHSAEIYENLAAAYYVSRGPGNARAGHPAATGCWVGVQPSREGVRRLEPTRGGPGAPAPSACHVAR